MTDFMDRQREMEISYQNNYLSIIGEQKTDYYGSSYYTSSYYETTDSINFYTELKSDESNNMWSMGFDYTATNSDYDIDTSLEMKLVGIYEYSESGVTSGFQADEDTVIMQINQVTWGDWSDVSKENDTYYSYCAEGYGGVVKITVYITDTTAEVDGIAITSNDIKFDLNLNGFPFFGVETRIAACFEMATDGEVREEVNEMAAPVSLAVDSSSGLTSGFFTWVDHVDINQDGNETANIVVSNSNGYYCFAIDTTAQPGWIYWDPVIGVSASALTENVGGTDDGNAASMQSVLIAFFVAVIALLFQ